MSYNKWSLDVAYVLIKWRQKSSKLCDMIYCITTIFWTKSCGNRVKGSVLPVKAGNVSKAYDILAKVYNKNIR